MGRLKMAAAHVRSSQMHHPATTPTPLLQSFPINTQNTPTRPRELVFHARPPSLPSVSANDKSNAQDGIFQLL